MTCEVVNMEGLKNSLIWKNLRCVNYFYVKQLLGKSIKLSNKKAKFMIQYAAVLELRREEGFTVSEIVGI